MKKYIIALVCLAVLSCRNSTYESLYHSLVRRFGSDSVVLVYSDAHDSLVIGPIGPLSEERQLKSTNVGSVAFRQNIEGVHINSLHIGRGVRDTSVVVLEEYALWPEDGFFRHMIRGHKVVMDSKDSVLVRFSSSVTMDEFRFVVDSLRSIGYRVQESSFKTQPDGVYDEIQQFGDLYTVVWKSRMVRRILIYK